jgi:hypothetical protein
MLSTALSSPGYTEFCRHQHEIEKRVRERARSALNYPYYPYRGKPPRKRTYKQQFGEDGVDNVIQLHPSKERHAKTMERIRAVIAMLKSEGAFPKTAYERTQAIIKKSKAAYGKGVSQTTLYKEEYLPLWHPRHENTEGVKADSSVEKYPILPDPWEAASEEPKPEQEPVSGCLHVADSLDKVGGEPEPLQQQAFKSLHVTPHYEGYCLPPAKQAGGLGESVSDDESQPQVGESNSEVGGVSEVVTSFDQEQQPQAASDSVEIPTENSNQGIIFLNGTIPEISSIQQIINSKSSKFSIHQIHLEHDFEQFIDNQNLSTTGGGVLQNIDKLNLSFTQTVCSPNIQATPDSTTPPEPSFEAPTEADNPSSEQIHPNDCSTPSSLSQTSQEQSSNSPLPENIPQPSTTAELFVQSPECSTTAEHFSGSDNDRPENGFTPLEYRQAIHFRFKAQKKAKEYQQEFFAFRNIRLMPQQRQDYENIIKYYLMLESSHNPAKQEAGEWFTTHQELVNNAREIGLWDYLEQLPPPDF